MATPKLDKETRRLIGDLRTNLDALQSEVQDYIDGKSDRWRESDTGEACAAWVDNIVELLDALDAFPEKPEV